MDQINKNKTEESFPIPNSLKLHKFNGLNNKEIYKQRCSPNIDEKTILNIKIIFNNEDIKLTSNILSFLEFKDIIKFKNTNKYFQKLLLYLIFIFLIKNNH